MAISTPSRGPRRTQSYQTPWCWTFTLQNCEKMNFCYFGHATCRTFFGNLSQLTQSQKACSGWVWEQRGDSAASALAVLQAPRGAPLHAGWEPRVQRLPPYLPPHPSPIHPSSFSYLTSSYLFLRTPPLTKSWLLHLGLQNCETGFCCLMEQSVILCYSRPNQTNKTSIKFY